MPILQSQIRNGRTIPFMKTSQTWRMYPVYFNLLHSSRFKKDQRKSIPRQLMTRNARCEVSLRRSKGEEKCNKFPRLPLLQGQEQAGTNHPLSKNHGNPIICIGHEDKDVSFFVLYGRAWTGTESPPAGPPAGLSSGLSPCRWLRLFPSQVMLFPFREQEVVLGDQPPFQESSA